MSEGRSFAEPLSAGMEGALGLLLQQRISYMGDLVVGLHPHPACLTFAGFIIIAFNSVGFVKLARNVA